MERVSFFLKMLHWIFTSAMVYHTAGNYALIIFFLFPVMLSKQGWLMFFLLCLSNSNSPKIFGPLLSILADCKNAAVWVVTICPLISNSSSSRPKSLEPVPSAPVIIVFTNTLVFHSFLSSQAKSNDIFAFFDLHYIIHLESETHYTANYIFFLLIITRFHLLAGFGDIFLS